MTDFWQAAAGWLGHAALAGGAVLLLGWVGVRAIRAPALRQRLAAWTVRAAVLAAVLCLFPAWLTVPAPDLGVADAQRMSDADPATVASRGPEPGEAVPAPPAGPDGTEYAAAHPSPGWDLDIALDPVAVVDLPPKGAAPQQIGGRGATPAPAGREPRAEKAPAPQPAAPPAAPQPTPQQPSPSLAATVAPLGLLAYAVVAAALLAQLLLGHVGLIRLVRAARPAPFRVRAVFDELTAGSRRKPRLLVSDRVASPVCFGLVRPTVLLPEPLARAGTEAELRWIFAHELDHVRRGDLATGWWVGVARAVYFFVPWFWPLRRELSLAQEYLADAAAAAADGRPVDYAAFLVDLSGGPARVPRVAHAVRAGKSDLFRRVNMLLQSGAGLDRRCPRGWTVLAAGGVLSAAVLLSGLGVASADDEKPREENKVEKVQKVQKPKASDKKPEKPRADADDEDDKRPPEPPRPPARANVDSIKKAITEAARKGDVDEVRKQVERLEQALRAARPLPPVPPLPPNFNFPKEFNFPQDFQNFPNFPEFQKQFPNAPFGQFNGPEMEQRMKEAMEKGMKGFEKSLEKLKDNPEAREQIERAMKQYQQAMEQAMKRAAEAQDKARQARDGERGARRSGGVRLGVGVGPVPELLAAQFNLPEGQGVYVTEVMKGSAAEKAGLQKGDVIVSFAGKEVPASPEQFAELVARTKPGQAVSAVVLRKGKKETIKGIELTAAEQSPPRAERRSAQERESRNRVAPKGEKKPGDADGKTLFERTSIQVNDDQFTIDATRGDVRYRVTGTLEGGKAVPSAIRVSEGKKSNSYKSLGDVPEEHRAAVKQLLGNISGGR